jgi:hypothetical protein
LGPRVADDGFWAPQATGHRIDAALALIRTEVRRLAEHEPPLNSVEVYLNDHGENHLRSVLGHAKCLVSGVYAPSFFATEQAVLCAAIWLHDIGLFEHPPGEEEAEVRRLHAERSGAFVHSLHKTNPGVVSRELADILAEVCLAHRRDYDLTRFAAGPRIPEVSGVSLRGDLIAALLRIADAADVGHGRTPAALYAAWGDKIPAGSRGHWHGHSLVHASTVDPKTTEVIFHLTQDADIEDRDLVGLVVATVEDVDSTRRTLEHHGLRPWNVRLEQRGRYISPAGIYGRRML